MQTAWHHLHLHSDLLSGACSRCYWHWGRGDLKQSVMRLPGFQRPWRHRRNGSAQTAPLSSASPGPPQSSGNNHHPQYKRASKCKATRSGSPKVSQEPSSVTAHCPQHRRGSAADKSTSSDRDPGRMGSADEASGAPRGTGSAVEPTGLCSGPAGQSCLDSQASPTCLR